MSAAVLVAVYMWLVGASVCYRFPEPSGGSNETRARTIRTAIQNWRGANLHTDRCPTFQELVDEKHLDTGTSGVDSWGHNFEWRCADDEVYVASSGPDGIRNTADDISIPKTDEMWARTIRAAIRIWQLYNHTDRCPTFQELVDEKHLDTGTSGVDSWGHNFELRCTDTEVYVASSGPDGIRDTADDISIPKTNVPAPPDSHSSVVK
jgi:hypothetical protein